MLIIREEDICPCLCCATKRSIEHTVLWDFAHVGNTKINVRRRIKSKAHLTAEDLRIKDPTEE